MRKRGFLLVPDGGACEEAEGSGRVRLWDRVSELVRVGSVSESCFFLGGTRCEHGEGGWVR